ncbi:lisH domain-containing protein isoform X1 [Spatholobus suberectus]|nr:lisH domain-containing protein isoform X1 [Spatholobus suberectus]
MRKKLLIATTKGLSFRSNHSFTPKTNHLSFEVCYSVGPLKVRQRGWSHAASVPSEAPDAQKGRKRVTRHERRAMVESFVNKYRTENAGKFPKISDTKKQVGGSYYVIREIVQELEYKSKMNSSNGVDEILVEKQFDESKLLATESVNVSSSDIEIAKDSPIQDDSQLVVLNDKETVNGGYEHLEEKREPQTSYRERRLSEEVEIVSTPSNRCIVSESNLVDKCSKEPYPPSLHMPNDIKAEEAVSKSDSFAPESQLLQEEREHFSPSFGENNDTGYGKAQGHEYDFLDMENCQKVEEECIKKADSERKEQPDLEDLSRELSHSSLQVPNFVKSGEAVSSSSDSVTQERHLLKEEIEQFSAPFIEKSVSEGYERKDQDAVDGPKHKIEQSQRPLELDESKMDSNSKEISVAVGSEKSTLWGNLKSFANGIINIWKKL